MPVVKYEKNFGELVDSAAEKKDKITAEWNLALYELYGSEIDPITRLFYRLIGKSINKITPERNPPIKREQNTPKLSTSSSSTTLQLSDQLSEKNYYNTSQLKYSSLSYILLTGPLIYPRSLIILFAILTLIFRLSDPILQETTATFTNNLDLLINLYFIVEGILRLCTIPAVFEIRKRCFDNNSPPANSLIYEILRSGWIEILISLLSITISARYNSTNAICWFNLFRLSFIANCYIIELPQIEVLLVSFFLIIFYFSSIL